MNARALAACLAWAGLTALALAVWPSDPEEPVGRTPRQVFPAPAAAALHAAEPPVLEALRALASATGRPLRSCPATDLVTTVPDGVVHDGDLFVVRPGGSGGEAVLPVPPPECRDRGDLPAACATFAVETPPVAVLTWDHAGCAVRGPVEVPAVVRLATRDRAYDDIRVASTCAPGRDIVTGLRPFWQVPTLVGVPCDALVTARVGSDFWAGHGRLEPDAVLAVELAPAKPAPDWAAMRAEVGAIVESPLPEDLALQLPGLSPGASAILQTWRARRIDGLADAVVTLEQLETLAP